MKKILSALDIYDLCGTAGAILLLYGVSRWSGPAAYVLAGIALIAIAARPLMRKVEP